MIHIHFTLFTFITHSPYKFSLHYFFFVGAFIIIWIF